MPWLYDCVLADFGVCIEFPEGVPAIVCRDGRHENWTRLVAQIDPDLLVCLALAKRLPSVDEGNSLDGLISKWPIVFGPYDRDLRQLFSKGLTDLHIHFKSLWPVALSWERLMQHGDRFGHGLKLEKLPAYEALSKSSHERLCLQRAIATPHARSVNFRHLEQLRPPLRRFFQNDGQTATDIGESLAPERLMLIAAWRRILTDSGQNILLEAELDEYSVVKSIFRTMHTQSVDNTNKGLVAFDAIRKANSHLGRFGREETENGGFSLRRYRVNNAHLFLALLNCKSLRQAEVRIAPPDGSSKQLVKQYHKTFDAAGRLLEDLGVWPSFSSTSTPLNVNAESPSAKTGHAEPASKLGNHSTGRRRQNVKMALHFKRAVKPGGANIGGYVDGEWRSLPTANLLRKLLEFDRETAAFHDYRFRYYGGKHKVTPNAADLVSRIDFASPERGAGPWFIAPYVLLLKGNPQMLAALSHESCEAYFPKWRCLLKQGRAQLPLGCPDLRLTCHAGEDFYLLADGLWHIDASIDTWKMGPGDALGHCLALGLSPEQQLTYADSIRVPAGVELDSLIWLRRLARKSGYDGWALLNDLSEWIIEQAHDIYRNASLHLDALEKKVAAAGKPILVPESLALSRLRYYVFDVAQRGADIDPLRLLDLFDPGVASRRQKLKKPASIHGKLCDLITKVQRAILAEIIRRGITIETNPSSNMRMERIDDPAKLPILNLLESSEGRPRVTVCTDNPGTYNVNVENECRVSRGNFPLSCSQIRT